MNYQQRIESIDYSRRVHESLAENGQPMRSRSDVVPLESTAREDVFVLKAPLDPAPGTTLFERLRQRKLCRWTLGYLAVAWMLLQLTDVLSDVWSWSLLAQQMVSVVLGLGVLPAVVVAWYHGEKGRQQVCKVEVAILAALILAAGLTIRTFWVGTLA